MEEKSFNILVSCNAPILYPTDMFFGVLYCLEDKFIGLPKLSPTKGEWGKVLTTQFLLEDEFPMPIYLDMVYLSIVEQKFYSIEAELPIDDMKRLWNQKDNSTGVQIYEYVLVGMAPFGGVSIWLVGDKKEILISWLACEETEVEMPEFMPHDPYQTLESVCDSYINSDPIVKENLKKNGLPSRNLFDKYMQQFTYRYLPMFEKWDKDEKQWKKYEEGEEKIPEFEYIEETLYDGTHDKLHDDGLLKYHEAGKPKKLAVKWHIKKSEYSAYFWFEDKKICSIYDKFYGTHRDTKVDFIIHIDAEKKKYELALYRYGLKESQIIPEDVYQLIVFKNKFENYRSENYNQERGAWIW